MRGRFTIQFFYLFWVLSIFILSNSALGYSTFEENFFQDQNNERKHPITHENQYYIVPSDAQNGDNVGKVYELWTDSRFNDRSGQSYSFEIVGGNNNSAFSIERNTGEIIVNNNSAISGNFVLSVRVSIGTDSQITKAHIQRIDSKDIVYFDSQASSGGNGSRSSPYRSFSSSGQGNGVPGKFYLYRRGRTYANDRAVIQTSENDKKITFGAWGKGSRPLLDGQNNNNRGIQIGSVFSSSSSPSLAGNNVDVMDLEMTRYQGNALAVSRLGRNFNFRRLKFSHTTTHNGFLYLFQQVDSRNLYPSNVYACDIEVSDFTERGIKIERGGEASNPIVFENIKAYKGGSFTYVSSTDQPYVTIRYLDNVATRGFGPNIRYGQNNLEWAYIKGTDRGIFFWKRDDKHQNITGAYVRDIIIDGTGSNDGIMFEKHSDASQAHQNIEISRVLIKNSGRNGINIQQGAKNITVSYVVIHDSKANGIRIDGSTSGVKIHNSIILDNSGRDIDASSSTEVRNSIFTNHSGSLNQGNNSNELKYFENREKRNYRPKPDASYLGKGSNLSYKFDLDGNSVPKNPSIGAFELEGNEQSNLEFVLDLKIAPNNSAGNISRSSNQSTYSEGEKIDLIAEPSNGYQFLNWTIDGEKISGDRSFTFTMPDREVTLVANFEEIAKYTLSLESNPTTGGKVENRTGGQSYEDGSKVEVSAIENEGYEFINWTVDGKEVSKTKDFTYTISGSDVTLRANFEKTVEEPVATYSLTLQASPTEGGKVENRTGGLSYEEGSKVEVSAIENEGYEFINWTVDGQEVSKSKDFTYTIPGSDVTLKANFEVMEVVEEENVVLYSIVLSANPSNAGNAATNPGPTEVEAGKKVKVVAESNQGFRFSHWEKDGKKVSEERIYEFVMPEKDIVLEAHFEELVGPSATWLSPTAGFTFMEGENIFLELELKEGDSEIVSVEYFRGNTLIGESKIHPFEFTWKNAPVGSHTLSARVKDTNDLVAITSNISIEVEADELPLPVISLLSPDDGSVFEVGDNLTLKAQASSENGDIEKVEFFRGNTLIGESIKTPFEYTWTNLPEGNFSITARATDSKGQKNTSSPSQIRVEELEEQETQKSNLAPSVSIVSPKDLSEFESPVDMEIEVIAEDEDGEVVRVEIFKGNTLLTTLNKAPYRYVWKNAEVGSHTLTAKATDNEGLSKTSAIVNVTVEEEAQKPNQAPNVKITSPRPLQVFEGPSDIEILVEANDVDGEVEKVEIFRGTTLLTTLNKAPYRYIWKNVKVGNYSLTAKATDNEGLSKISTVVNISVEEIDEHVTDEVDENLSPIITWVKPEDEAYFIRGEDIKLEVEAIDLDGEVVKVDYYNEDELIGTSESIPFDFLWKDAPVGKHFLTAVVWDNESAFAESETLTIYVNEEENLENKEDDQAEIEIKIGPNPTRDILTVFFENVPDGEEMKIYVISMRGDLELEFSANSSDKEIKLLVSRLKNGPYVLRVESQSFIFNTKFIKN